MAQARSPGVVRISSDPNMFRRFQVPLLRHTRTFSSYGYLGKHHSFGNVALRGYFKASNCPVKEGSGFPTPGKLITALQQNEIEMAILPVETSMNGVIGGFYDTIVWQEDL